jgi:hypothetical protein
LGEASAEHTRSGRRNAEERLWQLRKAPGFT